MIQPTPNYVFLPKPGEIIFPDGPPYGPINQAGVSLIVNVTAGVIIYNPASHVLGQGGSWLDWHMLKLAYDTSSMNPTDALIVVYDDGTQLAPAHVTQPTNVLLVDILEELKALRAGLVNADIIQEV